MKVLRKYNHDLFAVYLKLFRANDDFVHTEREKKYMK